MSRGYQWRNRGNVGHSVERDDEFFDTSTEFDDTSLSCSEETVAGVAE